jgi:hypothetical protein
MSRNELELNNTRCTAIAIACVRSVQGSVTLVLDGPNIAMNTFYGST